jgi:hypothetical protein
MPIADCRLPFAVADCRCRLLMQQCKCLNKVWGGWGGGAKSGSKAVGDYFVVSRRQKVIFNRLAMVPDSYNDEVE